MQAALKMYSINLDMTDIEKTWNTLDIDESGTLTIDELVTGFSFLQEALETKHVANIGYALKRLSASIDRDIEAVEEAMATIKLKQDDVLMRVYRQRERDSAAWVGFAKGEVPSELAAARESM